MPRCAIYELTLQPVVAYSSQWQTATLVIIKMRTRVLSIPRYSTAVYTRLYSWHNGRPHHLLGGADDHPLHRRRLRAEREPECEAAGGVLPRLRHHPDPGGHAGGDRRREGQIVSFRRKRSAIPKRLQLFGKGRSSARRAERFLL